MSFDRYAELAGQAQCPAAAELPARLAGGFVDGCTAWFATAEIERAQHDGLVNKEHDKDKKKELRNRVKAFEKGKNEARNCYMKRAEGADLLTQQLADLLDPVLPVPQPGWLAIEVSFALKTPWSSKDDRPFHVLDNPVRKDRVFGVPYMSAASWKGLLRWAYRMHTGLIGPAPIQNEEQRRKARAYELHLFGNEKGEKEDFLRGALAFYPTWFDKVRFEVINPHSRKTRAGTQPILYEVVRDTEGVLRLLYAPLPGDDGLGVAERIDALQKLLDAAEQLLTVYGFSAKRTAGWGIAEVTGAGANGGEWEQENPIQKLRDKLPALLGSKVEKA